MFKRLKALFKENWRATIVATLVTEFFFWLPVWLPALLSVVFQSAWFLTVSVGVIAFWAGPFTPAVPLQLVIIAWMVGKFKTLSLMLEETDITEME